LKGPTQIHLGARAGPLFYNKAIRGQHASHGQYPILISSTTAPYSHEEISGLINALRPPWFLMTLIPLNPNEN